MDQGLVTFPGLDTFSSAEYTNSQGISPGICTIEMPVEFVSDLNPSGDLTFSYGDQSVTIPDCIVDLLNIDTSLGGYMARVQILDRRWRWRDTAAVSGHYNLPQPLPQVQIGNNDPPAGQQPLNFKPNSERDPQTLLSYCLDAMQEVNYDVSQVPNDARPEIHWSYENPANAMASLAQQLGCRIVLDLDDSHVIFAPIGRGDPLPNNEFVTFPQEGLQAPITPSAITIVGDPTLYQGYFQLQAVGLDLDGTIKKLNDLSYKPNTGWLSEDPSRFPSIQDPYSKALAHQTVYKWFRPVQPLKVPDGSTTGSSKEVILHDRQLDSYLNFYSINDTPSITAAAEVFGWFDAGRSQARKTPTNTKIMLYRGSVSIDSDRCLVITGDPLYMITAGAAPVGDGALFQAPQIWVKTSISVCDSVTLEPVRYKRTRQLQTQNQTPPRFIKEQALCKHVRGLYDDNLNLTGYTDNAANGGLEDFASYLLNAAASEYVTDDSFVITYARIEPIQLDGQRQQVTYSIQCGEGGSTTTRASINAEHNPYVPRYKVRRDREELYKLNLRLSTINPGTAQAQLRAYDAANGAT